MNIIDDNEGSTQNNKRTRDGNISPHKNDMRKGHRHNATVITRSVNNERDNTDGYHSKQISHPHTILNNSLIKSMYIKTEGSDSKINKEKPSNSVQNDVESLSLKHFGKNKTHVLSLNYSRNLSNKFVKRIREKRSINVDLINSKRKGKYLDLDEDIIGGGIVQEDLLPFYRPTKYFLSPQLSMETKASKDKVSSGKFHTSTIRINDVERDYFASIATRSRRTTAAASSSFILSKQDDDVDESDLSSMVTSQHKLTKTEKRKEATRQTFKLTDNDNILRVDTQFYESGNDRRPVLTLRSIDDLEDDTNKNTEDEKKLMRKRKREGFPSQEESIDETSVGLSKYKSHLNNITSDGTVINKSSLYHKNSTKEENGTFYDPNVGESDDLLDDSNYGEFATSSPLDYLMTVDDFTDDDEKQYKLAMISKILKDVEQQAIQGSNCTPGTGLNMGDIDLVGNNYKKFRGAADVAVNRANWLTRIWKYASDVVLQSEYLLQSSLFSMIESNEMIFGAGNCYDGEQYKNYSLFCPFAYKLPDGHILGKDLAVEYKYLKNTSTWFWIPKQHAKQMAKDLARFETGKIIYFSSLNNE